MSSKHVFLKTGIDQTASLMHIPPPRRKVSGKDKIETFECIVLYAPDFFERIIGATLDAVEKDTSTRLLYKLLTHKQHNPTRKGLTNATVFELMFFCRSYRQICPRETRVLNNPAPSAALLMRHSNQWIVS